MRKSPWVNYLTNKMDPQVLCKEPNLFIRLVALYINNPLCILVFLVYFILYKHWVYVEIKLLNPKKYYLLVGKHQPVF